VERLTAEQVNTFYPVCGVTIYPKAVVVKRLCTMEMRQSQRKKRGQVIVKLSKRSLSNFAFLVSTSSVVFRSLLTLSYGKNYPVDGKKVKRDLTRFLTWIKRKFTGLEYFWFLEFQERGAPHLHLGLSIDYPGRVFHGQMAARWAKICNEFEGVYCEYPSMGVIPLGIVCDGCSSVLDDVASQHRRGKVWENIRSADGAIRYVLSYACKPHQKTVPPVYSNVGRFWGNSYGVRAGGGVDFAATEAEVRELMGVLGRNLGNFDVLPKYLFHSGNLPENISSGKLDGVTNCT